MNIKIITVGKIKEKYIQDGISEYAKRLSAYCKIEIIEVQDEKTLEGMSAAEEAIIKNKEAERISRYIKEGTFLIPLAIEGSMYSSVELADFISELGLRGKSDLTFVIGGSLGLSEKILQKSNKLISFSKLTFPHQLMRLILMEQLYRVFRINHGEPYHK